jgi:dihydropteroate synthase
MGVLNATPDSFSDGGLHLDPARAMARAMDMEREGADVIDVGGESTRPGHTPVAAGEEQRRVLPVVRELASRLAVPISIDTYKASTARLALEAGAAIVNDVWGLQRDREMAAVVAAHGAMIVVMHNRERADAGIDIVDDMLHFFHRSLALAHAAGVADDRIILDPGIGFGKTAAQNLDALRRLPELRALGFPVLVGASRKSVLGHFYPADTRPAERLFGTIAAHVIAAARGADLVRVHDVRAHVEALRVADALARGTQESWEARAEREGPTS